MNLSDLSENNLIICENDYKKNILKKMSDGHLFLNVKFMTKREFFESYLFKVKDEAIYELIKKYGFKIDIAKMYIDNLFFIEDKTYDNRKLDFLNEIKTFLKEKDLLIFDDSFKEYIKRFKIFVIGYEYLENYEIEAFNSLNAKIVKTNGTYELKDVYEFDTIEHEIEFVLNKIAELIASGIDVNNIKLTGLNDEYYIPLTRLAKMYNIPIKIPKTNTLYASSITKDFLKYYDSNLENAFNQIKGRNPLIVNKIVSIINKYTFEEDKLKVKDFIINDLKNTKINNFHLKNYIAIEDINYPYEDEYVFLMGFNMGNIPHVIKDESYITDNLKEVLNMKSVSTINKEIKENLINHLRSIKNLSISYKKKTNDNEYYPSPIIGELKLNVITLDQDENVSYSLLNSKLKYACMLDNFEKYGTIEKNMDTYKNSLDIPYKSFDNRFKGIEVSDLKEVLNNKLTLSYSSLNNYSKCAFRYYLTNILRLDKYEDKFEAYLGSIFHDVLEKCLDTDLDPQKEVENYITESKRDISIKERFFINKVKDDIIYTVNVLRDKKAYIKMDKALYEQNIIIDKSTKDFNIEFTGFIDKLIYENFNNNTLVAIVDYKTGYVDIELKYLDYGLSMQLPIYLYLVKKGNLFANPIFVGFYLQMILNKDIKIDAKKSYDEQRKASLKLSGYSINDETLLERFDSGYAHSDLIKSMALGKDGTFGPYAKVLSEDDINKIIDLTEKVIDNAIREITKGNFAINPKKIGDKNIGCEFCKFKDICFNTEKDFVLLEEKDGIDYLGGEE